MSIVIYTCPYCGSTIPHGLGHVCRAMNQMWPTDMGPYHRPNGNPLPQPITEQRKQEPRTFDHNELRRALCVIGVVGEIDGHPVIRRESVLNIIDTRIMWHER